MDKILNDFQMRDGKTLNKKMIHAEIRDNNLVLIIDFESPNVAAWQYFQLQGIKFKEIEKQNLIVNLIYGDID